MDRILCQIILLEWNRLDLIQNDRCQISDLLCPVLSLLFKGRLAGLAFRYNDAIMMFKVCFQNVRENVFIDRNLLLEGHPRV